MAELRQLFNRMDPSPFRERDLDPRLAVKSRYSRRTMTRAIPFQRILVPMDFSAHAREAARVAGDLAKRLDARIRFLTVLDVGDLRVALKVGLRPTTSAELRQAVEDWVREQYATIEVAEGVPYTHTVKRGFGHQQILATIKSYTPDLVVMGSSGLARRLPFGSTTTKILRTSTVPVLVCRTRKG